MCIQQHTQQLTAAAIYRKVSNIRRTLVGNKIVDHSDVVGASPVGAAPTTSSLPSNLLGGGGEAEMKNERIQKQMNCSETAQSHMNRCFYQRPKTEKQSLIKITQA